MVSGLIISFHEGLIRGSSLPCSKMANDRDTMKDVSHRAPNDTSAKGVWERGRGPVAEEEEEEE
jgi:hypothetical protein